MISDMLEYKTVMVLIRGKYIFVFKDFTDMSLMGGRKTCRSSEVSKITTLRGRFICVLKISVLCLWLEEITKYLD